MFYALVPLLLKLAHAGLPEDCAMVKQSIAEMGNVNMAASIPDNCCESEMFVCDSSIKELRFGSRNLTGALSGSIFALPYLKLVDFSGNELSGQIPAVIGDLRYLEFLSLQANKFSGSVPSALGRLAFLKSLNLSNNLLEGQLPTSLQNLPALVEL